MSSLLGDVRVTFLLFRWDRFPRSCLMIMIVELQNFLGCLCGGGRVRMEDEENMV